jgi:hypothetical protein
VAEVERISAELRFEDAVNEIDRVAADLRKIAGVVALSI